MGQEQAEWIEALEQDNGRLETQLAEVKDSVQESISELENKEYHVQTLKARLAHAGAGQSTPIDVDNLIKLVCRLNQPTPLECLDTVRDIHGDKRTVLESARKSAGDMNRFVHGRRLLNMLLRLVTDYRTAILNGGDSQAKKCFGKNEFAAKESETVIGNKTMLHARTFEYDSKQVEMLRHLKIGIDDDETKTIRVHFHWDGEKKRIVIGHCGRHLPVASH